MLSHPDRFRSRLICGGGIFVVIRAFSFAQATRLKHTRGAAGIRELLLRGFPDAGQIQRSIDSPILPGRCVAYSCTVDHVLSLLLPQAETAL